MHARPSQPSTPHAVARAEGNPTDFISAVSGEYWRYACGMDIGCTLTTFSAAGIRIVHSGLSLAALPIPSAIETHPICSLEPSDRSSPTPRCERIQAASDKKAPGSAAGRHPHRELSRPDTPASHPSDARRYGRSSASAGKPGRTDRLGGRCPLLDPPGFPRHSGHDQPQRPAGQCGLWLYAGPVLFAGIEAARLSVLRLRLAGQDLSPRALRAIQGRPARHARGPVPQIGSCIAWSRPWAFRCWPARDSRPTTSWPRSPGLTDELGGRCFIVSGDKDCRQLITEHVKLYNIRKNELIDRDVLRQEWGIDAATRWSTTRPWSAIRPTTCPACR